MQRETSRSTTLVKIMASALVSALLLISIIGCTPKFEKTKSDLLSAIDSYEQFENFRFQGSATIQLNELISSAKESEDAVTAALMQSLLDSSFRWSGTLDHEAERWELNLDFAPADSDVSFQIPFLLEQNTLYFRLPFFNKPDEYWMMDTHEFSSSSAHDLGYTFNRMFRHMVAGLNAKWFEIQQTKGSSDYDVYIELNQKNILSWLLALKTAMPNILSELEQAKLVSPTTLDAWKERLDDPEFQEQAKRLIVNKAGGLTVTVNEAEQVIGYQFSLDVQLEEQGEPIIVEFEYTLEDINKQPSFNLETPETTRSITDILNLLTPSQP